MNNSLNVVLITSGQPSLNPRLVKEADALAEANYNVTVIYQFWNDWGTKLDKQLLPEKKWKAIRVGGSPQENKLRYWFSRIQHKFAKTVITKFGFKFYLAEKAAGRCTFLLLKEALRHPADLYIAHNLAALPAAVIAAKKRKVKCGFDAEDFHRNEVSDDPTNADVLLKSFLENKYVPQTDYFTTSSKPIAALYQKLFPEKEITTILNVFPVAKAVKILLKNLHEPLRLFWFSQNIGLNRGLQDILSALKTLENEQIELHLLGFLSEETNVALQDFIKYLNFSKKPVVIFYSPVNPDQLPVFASKFDVGLALEPGFCLNNNVALSNKIFTYLQAGLALVASDTSAQKQFLDENPDLGFCYKKGDYKHLSAILKRLIDEPDLLQQTKQAAFNAARSNLNWETESAKFLKVVEKTLAG